jgi:hypothetical protein
MGMSGVSTLKAGHSIPAEPELGRFISRDPIGFRGGLNLYGTAFGNNPVTFVDPGGLDIGIYLSTRQGPGPNGRFDFSPDRFGELYKFMLQHPEEIVGLETWGHSKVTLAGAKCDSASQYVKNTDQFVISGISRESDNSLVLLREVPVGKGVASGAVDYETFDISNIKLPNLKFAYLWGCNTAGGHPRTEREQFTDDNIASFLSKLWSGATVTGNRGPFHGGRKWDYPATYQNGNPIPSTGVDIKMPGDEGYHPGY